MDVGYLVNLIINFLAFAAIAFFFFPRKDKDKEKREETPPKRREPIRDELESERIDFSSLDKKPKAKSNKAVKTHKETVVYKRPGYLFKDDSDELNSNRPILKSSRVMKLRSIPSIHGEFVDRSPQIRKIVKNQKSLRNLVICREIIERPDTK